ncbi:MAG: hypothetical protein HYR56_19340 [Acidobacteria bacterium]|nr:hypothetical protein [Acidobacteriota bacterium]MBI3424196.1 hypothetical protein [Acidobacteriota bacterium]
MTHEEITATLASATVHLNALTVTVEGMAEQQKVLLTLQAATNAAWSHRQEEAEERLVRMERTLEWHSNHEADVSQTLERHASKHFDAEQILERLSEKQFHQDLKNEELENALNRTAQLLIQAALNNADGHKRLDRLEASLALLDAKLDRLSDTVDRYIAFRTNGHNGNH